MQPTGNLYFQTRNSSGTSYSVESAANAILINNWYHVAATRQAGNLLIFVNGVSSATSSVNDNSTNLGVSELAIGLFNEVNYVRWATGYMDEFRMTTGIARYTSTFAVPTVAFPDN